MATVADRLLTAEEFAVWPDDGPSELVRGKVVPRKYSGFLHGATCVEAAMPLHEYLDGRDLGRFVGGGAGVITERNPDTVRGADLSFYSYARVPRGRLPDTYLDAAPELVVEVFDFQDTWAAEYARLGEFLLAGVLAVVVIEPEQRRIEVFRPDRPSEKLGREDELTLPEVFSDFRAPVKRFFRD